VLFDAEPVRSCLMLAVQADGHCIETVEGLAESDGELSVLQRSFSEHHALQCGFCTAGFLMSAQALLRATPAPTEREVREGLAGNLCRCTGYEGIVAAVLAASGGLAGQPDQPSAG
jgi:carbon-monoxide dehydrogenase small subunit